MPLPQVAEQTKGYFVNKAHNWVALWVAAAVRTPPCLGGAGGVKKMSTQPDRSIRIELNIRASQPELLEGLDAWLRLGLLSDAQVRQLCQQYLSSPLPQPAAPAQVVVEVFSSRGAEVQGGRGAEVQGVFSPSLGGAKPAPLPPPSAAPGLVQSLMAELSVRWLLFLGVFMVVLSSGVLAASQWEKFPPAGQYLVLFAYTAIFWGVSQWAQTQRNLRLTADTLQLVTLLLVPLNFWAMDGFGLWKSPPGWIAIAIATAFLTWLAIRLGRELRATDRWEFGTQMHGLSVESVHPFDLGDESGVAPAIAPPGQSSKSVSCATYLLGLSYLHWGWAFPGFPLIVVYAGAVGTSVAALYQNRAANLAIASGARSRLPESQQTPLTLGSAVVVYATAVLLFRAIFVAQVPIAQLGLAIGLCGWLLAWLSQRSQEFVGALSPRPYSSLPPSALLDSGYRTGGFLLFLGWLVSVWTVPAQAIAVSGLALWLLGDRLRRFWHRFDLVAIFCIGLQAFWLIRQVTPPWLRQTAIATGTQLTSSEQTPWVLLGLTLFPYVVFMLWLTDWLYRRDQPDLGNLGDKLTLGLGTVLTLLTLPNPTVRSLNLLASTLTLAIATHRRWTKLPLGDTYRIPLVYLTHITCLLSLCSAIDFVWQQMPVQVWASIFVAIMVAEWGTTLILNTDTRITRTTPSLKAIWERSAWHIGLSLASLSYSLFSNYHLSAVTGAVTYPAWGILWLITPLALTIVAGRGDPPGRREVASSLSAVCLGVAQWLTLHTPATALIGFGVATCLMLPNTRYLRHKTAAAIALGFGLCFCAQLLAMGVPGFPPLSPQDWLVAGAIAIACLWLLHGWLIRRSTPLAAIYAPAADGWAIALCSLEILSLTAHSLGVYWQFVPTHVTIIVAIIVTMGAIAYRNWRSQPSNLGIYALGWCLELLTAETLGFFGRSLINLAIANILLGLITQIAGDWWQRRTGTSNLRNSWNVMPLLYGIMGAVLRWGTFTSGTGLLSMGLALIAIGVGRRSPEFKPLVYLAMAGVSISAYELLYYQIYQMAEGDRFIRMAALGTSIMYAYRVLTPWLVDYLHLTRAELKVAAHLHWGWSSCLLFGAIALPIQSGELLGLGTGIFLTNYAIIQGRHNPNPEAAEIWVYLGILEGVGVGTYLFSRLPSSIQEPAIAWGGAIACILAYFLHFLPWDTWGWTVKPWQRAAVVLPVATIYLTNLNIHNGTYVPWYISTLIAAGFYIFLAWSRRQIRLTYISAALMDWALLHWFGKLQLSETLWYTTPPALSLLYIAQIDPALKTAEQKPIRHNLRLLGTGAIYLVALFTQHWLLSGISSVVAIFAGLALRVRAFLYVGTLTFLLNAVNQLVILNSLYSLVRWVIGLLVGITLIWIAATFETRREQIVTLVQNWISELEEWE